MDIGRVAKAIDLLFQLHGNEKRKISGQSVAAHSMTVFIILREQTDDNTVLIAALLHGILRDKEGYTYKELEGDFGEKVASVVEELSEYKGKKGKERETWKNRKYRPLKAFSRMQLASQMILVISRAVNLTSLVNDYRCHGEDIWKKFNASEKAIATYYRDFYDILTSHFRHPLLSNYHDAYQATDRVFRWTERFPRPKKRAKKSS